MLLIKLAPNIYHQFRGRRSPRGFLSRTVLLLASITCTPLGDKLFCTFANLPTPMTPVVDAVGDTNRLLQPKSPLAFAATQALEQSRRAPTQHQHLVLIGGGHAHIQVIKALNAATRPTHLNVTLIDLQHSASYSGMVPGCIAGMYNPSETLLPLRPLAEWAGINFRHGRVVDIDLQQRKVIMEGEQEEADLSERAIPPFDVVSIDIGSRARDLDHIPGAQRYAIPTRPIHQLVQRLEAALQKECMSITDTPPHHPPQRPPCLVIIGGGAAGIELALAITGRWNQLLPHPISCTIVDSGDTLLPHESLGGRARLHQVLRQRSVHVRHNGKVQEVTAQHIKLQSGETIPYDYCVWSTGAEAQPLAWRLQQKQGLELTQKGWIKVSRGLQSTSHPFVFAAGDCAEIHEDDPSLSFPTPPKAGVYAVRAGPVLIENLIRYLRSLQENEESANLPGTELITYQPQEDYLKLLVTGDGKALGFRYGLPLYGKWVWQLKDCIDRGFMQLFDASTLPDHSQLARGVYDTNQYDQRPINTNPMHPGDAAKLLQRTDDDVDYREAWDILRAMAQNENYRQAVLDLVNITTEEATVAI